MKQVEGRAPSPVAKRAGAHVKVEVDGLGRRPASRPAILPGAAAGVERVVVVMNADVKAGARPGTGTSQGQTITLEVLGPVEGVAVGAPVVAHHRREEGVGGIRRVPRPSGS